MGRENCLNWNGRGRGSAPDRVERVTIRAYTPTMTRKLVIVGAGPVGCLAAMSFASMGWSVEIYEARPGNRTPPPTPFSSFSQKSQRQICACLLRRQPPSSDRLTSPSLREE